jgi:hypothetical protein
MKMLFERIGSNGRSFAKDPCVVKHIYYSTVVRDELQEIQSFAIGIAVSPDLDHWEKKALMTAEHPAEGKGVAAPGAFVRDDVVHLFYQSYGQFPKDYICHTTSTTASNFSATRQTPCFVPQEPGTSAARSMRICARLATN